MKNSNPNSSGAANACPTYLALVGDCVNPLTNLSANQDYSSSLKQDCINCINTNCSKTEGCIQCPTQDVMKNCTAYDCLNQYAAACLKNGYKWVESCIAASWASKTACYYEQQTLSSPSLDPGYTCISTCSNPSYGSDSLKCTQNGGNWTTVCCSSTDPNCCSNGLKKCNGTCCNINQICPAESCCDNCGGQCCGSNQTCINQQCVNNCNGSHCSPGEQCINDTCCDSNNICGQTCCSSSQTCFEDENNASCNPCGDICVSGWSTLLHCNNKTCCTIKNAEGECDVQCLPAGNSCYEITKNGTNCALDTLGNYYCCPEGWQKLEQNNFGFCCPQNTTGCGGSCCSSNEKCIQDTSGFSLLMYCI